MKTKTGNGRAGLPHSGFLCIAVTCLLFPSLLAAEYSDQFIHSDFSPSATESYLCDFRNHSDSAAFENYTAEVFTPYQNYSMAFNADSLDIKSSHENRTITCSRRNSNDKANPKPTRGVEVFRIPYTPVNFDPAMDIQPSPSALANEELAYSPPAFWPSSTPTPYPPPPSLDQTGLIAEAVSQITENMFNSHRILLLGELLAGLPDFLMPSFPADTEPQPLSETAATGHYLIVMHSLKKPGHLGFWDLSPSDGGETHAQNINNDIVENPVLEQKVVAVVSPLVSSGAISPAPETALDNDGDDEEYFDEMTLTQATGNLLLILQNRVDVLLADSIAKQTPGIEDRNLRLIRQNRRMLQAVERAELEYAKQVLYLNTHRSESDIPLTPTSLSDVQSWAPALVTATNHLTDTEQSVDMETPPASSGDKKEGSSSPSKSSGTSEETLKSGEKKSEDSEDEEEDDAERREPPVKSKPDSASSQRDRSTRQRSITYHLSTALNELNPASPEFESLRRALRQISITGSSAFNEAMEECYQTLIASYQNLSETVPLETSQNLAALNSAHEAIRRSSSSGPEVIWTFHYAMLMFIFQEFRQNHLAWVLAQHLSLRELSLIVSSTQQSTSPEPTTPSRRSFNWRSLSLGSRERPIIPPRPAEPPPQPGINSLAQAAAVSVAAPQGEESVPVLFSLRQNQQLMAGQEIGPPTAEVDERTGSAGALIQESAAVRLLGNPGGFLPTPQMEPTSVQAVMQRQIVSDLFRANFALTVTDDTARHRVFDSQRMAHFIRRAATRSQQQQKPGKKMPSKPPKGATAANSNHLDSLVRFRFNRAFRDAVMIMHSDDPAAQLVIAYSATQSLGNDIAQITFDDNQPEVRRTAPLLIPSSGNTNNLLYVTRELNDLHPQLQIYYGFNSLMHYHGLGQQGAALGRWRAPATGGLWVIATISQSLSGQIYANQIQWLFDVEQTSPIAGIQEIDSAPLAPPEETLHELTPNDVLAEIQSVISRFSIDEQEEPDHPPLW